MSQLYREDLNIDNYDPSLCPYCGHANIDMLDNQGESQKFHCYDCDGDFIQWYEDFYDEQPVEVTDGRNNYLL